MIIGGFDPIAELRRLLEGVAAEPGGSVRLAAALGRTRQGLWVMRNLQRPVDAHARLYEIAVLPLEPFSDSPALLKAVKRAQFVCRRATNEFQSSEVKP